MRSVMFLFGRGQPFLHSRSFPSQILLYNIKNCNAQWLRQIFRFPVLFRRHKMWYLIPGSATGYRAAQKMTNLKYYDRHKIYYLMTILHKTVIC